MSDASLPLEILLETAVSWALEAGRIQRKYYDSADKGVEHKGAIDLVTKADKEVEEFLIGEIERTFPEHGYLAEEGHEKGRERELVWIIDPLDGTSNFAHSYPVFCVSIALVHRGKPVVGVIHDPMRDETFTAVSGGGAFLNGRPIQVTQTDELKKSLLVSGFPYNFACDSRNLKLWGAFLHASLSVRRDGSAAIDLCYVACGRFEGFWELGLNAWDIAAGALIVEEAGGSVTNFDGSPLDLFGRNILATNAKVHQAMQQVLKDNGAY